MKFRHDKDLALKIIKQKDQDSEYYNDEAKIAALEGAIKSLKEEFDSMAGCDESIKQQLDYLQDKVDEIKTRLAESKSYHNLTKL